jgi:hypothetical protein
MVVAAVLAAGLRAEELALLPVVGAPPSAAPVSGAALLAACLARLPVDPVAMTGWLSMRRPRGIVTKQLGFKVELHWGGEPPLARYTVTDRDGEVLEQVVVRRGERVELARLAGPRLEPAPTPEWNARIQGSDVTWLDVTLGFLWWNDPRLVGEDTVKGRLCDVLEVSPPDPVPDCARVRLWLDRETSLLLKAEELDFEGRLNRQLWVRSARKMGERWMVSDLEVETRGSGHRTRLHILELSDAEAP